MAERNQRENGSNAALVADLNDVLRLDHDAVQAYTLAIGRLRDAEYRETVQRFREDHERHIDELTRLVRAQGGAPAELPHLPTGPFKLAVQAAGALGGDTGLILAFKANERQSRDKYRAAAQKAYPPEVAAVLRRGAADEATHYSWALETLDDRGVGRDTMVGRIERAIEIGNARMADFAEGVEKQATAAAERARSEMKGQLGSHPMRSAIVAVGVGVLAAALGGGRAGGRAGRR